MNMNRTYYSHDAEMRVARDRVALTAVCLLLGLGVGGMLALLFAPATGEKTRNELAHTLEGGVHSGQEFIHPAVTQLEKEFSDLRHKVEERLS
jgi:hypothetical protein